MFLSISRRAVVSLIAVVSSCALTTTASPASAAVAACKQIRQACLDAGFVLGGGKKGDGLQHDCIEPLITGKSAAVKAPLALPKISADVIAACAAARPGANTEASQDATTVPEQPAPVPAGAKPGPNIVLILADDFSMNLLTSRDNVLASSMPNLQRMMAEGATFTNYFVTDSLCCPSRTSIFTGKLPHNSGVFTNTPPWGGFGAFMKHDNAPLTFAVALHQAGYRTAMLGKYLNGYEPAVNGAPPGWSEWDVDGDQGYREFNYPLNENGKLVQHPEYLTDEIAKLGQSFIEASGKTPFFIELASFAPHAPYVPPERYKADFPNLTYDQSAPFGARADAAAPEWLKLIPSLDPAAITAINEAFRNRVRSDKAIDDMIGGIRAELKRLGLEQNTYIVFSSDNGYHMGEYSLRPGKMTPLDTDIKVPLVIVGPGVPAGRAIDAIAENIDLCPTFTELAGTPGPTEPDGHSLLPLLRAGGAPEAWRKMALIEHHHPGPDKTDPDLPESSSGNPPSYEAIRTADALYVEYSDTKNEIGYYDLKQDPMELHNIAGSLPAAKLHRLHEVLMANSTCKGGVACWAAQGTAAP